MSTQNSSEGHSVLKWILGVLGVIIGGVAVWWLTTGPFTKKHADVVILNVPSEVHANLKDIQDMKTTFDVEVHNKGNLPARQCYVKWKFTSDWDIRVTKNDFGVPPEETRIVTLDIDSFQQLLISHGSPYGNQKRPASTKVRLICSGITPRIYYSKVWVVSIPKSPGFHQ